jgi:hypothetical protein
MRGKERVYFLNNIYEWHVSPFPCSEATRSDDGQFYDHTAHVILVWAYREHNKKTM